MDTKTPSANPSGKHKCAKCNSTFDDAKQLARHVKRIHTLAMTVIIGDDSFICPKVNDKFRCPECGSSCAYPDSLSRHVRNIHGGETTIGDKRKLNDHGRDEDGLSVPYPKLTKVREGTSTVDRSTEKLSYKEAILAASSAIHADRTIQHQKIHIAKAGGWTPVSFDVSDGGQSFHMLVSPEIGQKVADQKLTGTFRLFSPESPSTSTGVQPTLPLLQHIIANSGMKKEVFGEYQEISKSQIQVLNEDWEFTPALRYYTSLLFAGCILMEGPTALLVNTVEPYGREPCIDAHYESFHRNDIGESSAPTGHGLYGDLSVVVTKDNDAKKLKIGLGPSNLLVTSSVVIGQRDTVSVGPATTTFAPSAGTRIFLDRRSCISATEALNTGDACTQVESNSKIAQLKQVRSKFDSLSTFTLCRATSMFTRRVGRRPITVWTLWAHRPGKNKVLSQQRHASKLFRQVATEILSSGESATLKRSFVENLLASSGEGSVAVKLKIALNCSWRMKQSA